MRPQQIPPSRLLSISAVCFVLFVICMALLFSGCASSKLGKGLNVAVITASTADYVTTRQAIDSGRGREGNALLGQGAIRQAVLKVAGTSGVILLANLAEHKGNTVAAHLVRVVVTAAWSAVAIHNAGVGR